MWRTNPFGLSIAGKAAFVAALAATAGCARFTAGCPIASERRITLDSPNVRRLLLEQGNRDAAVAGFWRQPHSEEEGVQRVREMMDNPEKYSQGRSEFLRAIAEEPGILLVKATYLQELEASNAKCFLNPLYTPTFEKIRIMSGPFKGRVGWTCAPVCGPLATPNR